MVVGILQLDIFIPGAQSLKEKRWVVKSFTTRLRNKFNVSIAEMDSQDKWQKAFFAVAHVGNKRSYTNEVLDKVLDFARHCKQIEVIDSKLEFV